MELMVSRTDRMNDVVYFVDDPYCDTPEGPYTLDEAEDAVSCIESGRKSWNHGNGPQWACSVLEA